MIEHITKCEDWFWRAFKGGIYFVGNNLEHYYRNGDEGYVAPQPEKAAQIFPMGAEMGYPPHQIFYANDLEKAGEKEKAHYWRLQAAEGGQPGLWYEIGIDFYDGRGVEKDPQKACDCFKRSIEEENNGYAYDMMGLCLFWALEFPRTEPRPSSIFPRADSYWRAIPSATNFWPTVIWMASAQPRTIRKHTGWPGKPKINPAVFTCWAASTARA